MLRTWTALERRRSNVDPSVSGGVKVDRSSGGEEKPRSQGVMGEGGHDGRGLVCEVLRIYTSLFWMGWSRAIVCDSKGHGLAGGIERERQFGEGA